MVSTSCRREMTTMTTMLLGMMGAVLCSLASTSSAATEVKPQADFNLQSVSGKWYMIGFATNAQWFVNHRSSMTMGTAMLMPTADGGLDMEYASLNADGSCWRMTHQGKKTNVPGKFMFRSERWNNDNVMNVVEVNYDDYALIHTVKTKGGVSTVLNKLYSRSPTVSPEVLVKFKKFSLDTGILEENIAILPQSEECPAA